jgi:arsenate reductase-like glutaredoxin family protein
MPTVSPTPSTISRSKACLKTHWINGWPKSVGKLLNRKGTTWRKLTPEMQAGVTDAASARRLMLTQASVIKRPVVVSGQTVLVGVNPEQWQRVLSSAR